MRSEDFKVPLLRGVEPIEPGEISEEKVKFGFYGQSPNFNCPQQLTEDEASSGSRVETEE